MLMTLDLCLGPAFGMAMSELKVSRSKNLFAQADYYYYTGQLFWQGFETTKYCNKSEYVYDEVRWGYQLFIIHRSTQ